MFSSDDEDRETEQVQHIDTSSGFGPEEDDSDKASVHTSDEEENSSHNTDIDEYASFNTDLEKYQYDQVRWNGVQNLRKYKIAKKPDKPKAVHNSKRKRKSKTEGPLDPAAGIPKEGKIHFDTRGNLWYSYKKDNVYISGKDRKAF